MMARKKRPELPGTLSLEIRPNEIIIRIRAMPDEMDRYLSGLSSVINQQLRDDE